MAKISGRDTGPEVRVRRKLHAMGYRFRLHVKDLPGKPDIVLPRHRMVVLVHGCFWHRHTGCRLAYTPKSRVAFWRKKFSGNVTRDAKTLSALRRNGWKVKVIWECETRDENILTCRLQKQLATIDHP